MGAAILIAVQLGLTHWFYLYIPWFFPLVAVALELAAAAAGAASSRSAPALGQRRRAGSSSCSIESARSGSRGPDQHRHRATGPPRRSRTSPASW